jgi:hypothetical protein
MKGGNMSTGRVKSRPCYAVGAIADLEKTHDIVYKVRSMNNKKGRG